MRVQATSPTNKADSATPSEGWSLLGCLPPEKTLSEIKLDGITTLIGRASGMDLKINSPRVSGQHAELVFVGSQLYIRDLGSTNGTFINRERVLQSVPVRDGDHIELADVEFLVRYQQPQKKFPVDKFSAMKKTVQDFNAIQDDWMLSQFNEFIQQRRVKPHYQIIVDLQMSQVCGYESLARSDVPGLEHPGKMFDAAELVNQEVLLSIICRERAVETAAELHLPHPVFMNTHPHENFDLDVLPSIVKLRHLHPDIESIQTSRS